MRTTSFAACCLIGSVTTSTAFANDKPARPEGACALDEIAKKFYMDVTSEAGCAAVWEAWETWCHDEYAKADGDDDWQEC